MNTDFCDTDNCFFPVSSSLKPTHTEHSKYRYDISEKTDLYQCAAAKCPSPGEVVGKLVRKNQRHSPNPAMSFFLQFLSILYNSPGKSHVCSSISHSHPMNFILFPHFVVSPPPPIASSLRPRNAELGDSRAMLRPPIMKVCQEPERNKSVRCRKQIGARSSVKP